MAFRPAMSISDACSTMVPSTMEASTLAGPVMLMKKRLGAL
jgi:hypothetical protein